MVFKACLALLSATVTAQVSTKPIYCADTCGFTFGSGTLEGWNNEVFDLASLCTGDGAGYSHVDVDNGHRYAANVCGPLAGSCDKQEYCDTNDVFPSCKQNTGALLEGMVKQYDYLEQCASNANLGVIYSCPKCNMIASTPTVDTGPNGLGIWRPRFIDGVQQPLSAGVMYLPQPEVPMSPIQTQYEFGKCHGVQTGYQVAIDYVCDCDQETLTDGKFFTDVHVGPFPTEPAGTPIGALNDCQFTLTFVHRKACYVGYCESKEGLSGGMIFLIILLVSMFCYLVFALFTGHKETGGVSIPDSHVATWKWLFCGCGFLGAGGSEAETTFTSLSDPGSNASYGNSYSNGADQRQEQPPLEMGVVKS